MPQAISSQPTTLDQRRASHAWDTIQQIKQLPKNEGKEYCGNAKKLPTRIMAAGLGQALAFILAKAGDPNTPKHKAHLKRIHDDLTDWVIVKRPMAAVDTSSLVQSIIKGDSDFLRRATDEVLAYLTWFNRFAEAEGLTDEEES